MKLEDSWPGLCTLSFIILGFIIAIILRDSLFSYFSIFLVGCLAARVYFQRRSQFSRSMMTGFLSGYLMIGFWASLFLIFLAFILGFAFSYYLSNKLTSATFKNKLFIM